MRTTCFWSIMALNNLEFVYIPSAVRNIKISEQTIGDLLLNRSLYEIMHPNEIELAKSDLSTFFQLKTLAGSVTRCRLLPLQNVADLYAIQKRTQENFKYNSVSATNQNEISWSIVDLVIYTATNDTVLMCIHNTDLELYCQHGNIKSLKTSCQSRNSFTEEDVSSLAQIMLEKEVTRTAPNKLPIRIFQIVDQLSGLPLFIWPPNSTPTDNSQMTNINEMVQTISKEMLLKEFKSSTFDQQQNEILCTRHFYASSKHKFLEELCLFQRILIPYGNIIFESFQVSPMQDIKPVTSSMIHQHYYKDIAQPLIAPPPSLQLQFRQQQQQKQHEAMMKDDGKFYNSIHNIVSRPASASITTTELAIGEIEHQMLPGNLLAAVTTRSQEDDFYQEQFNQSPTSLFQKFRLNQHVVQQETSPIERRRKLLYNGQQHHPFFTPGMNDMNNNGNTNVKVCTRCRTSNSPEWRRGPDGHKTLCNACGLRYSRFRSKQWRTAANNKQ